MLGLRWLRISPASEPLRFNLITIPSTSVEWSSASSSPPDPDCGLGFGLCSFLDARLVPGFGLFAEHTGLKARLAEADLVLTGEGSIDKSTLMGKGVGELAAICRQAKIPCLGLAGAVNDRAAVAQLFTRTYAMSPDLTDRATAMANNAEWLARLASHAASQWKDS